MKTFIVKASVMDAKARQIVAVWDAGGIIGNLEEARMVLKAILGQGNPNPNPNMARWFTLTR